MLTTKVICEYLVGNGWVIAENSQELGGDFSLGTIDLEKQFGDDSVVVGIYEDYIGIYICRLDGNIVNKIVNFADPDLLDALDKIPNV